MPQDGDDSSPLVCLLRNFVSLSEIQWPETSYLVVVSYLQFSIDLSVIYISVQLIRC